MTFLLNMVNLFKFWVPFKRLQSYHQVSPNHKDTVQSHATSRVHDTIILGTSGSLRASSPKKLLVTLGYPQISHKNWYVVLMF